MTDIRAIATICFGTLLGCAPAVEGPASDETDLLIGTERPSSGAAGDTGGEVGADSDAPDEDEGNGGDTGGEVDEPEEEWVCAEEIRNGSEICDDAAFGVPDPFTPMAIRCVTGEGGVAYVSTNTGPVMEDGIARCQGWEENGQNAWDHLQYVAEFDCAAEGQFVEVDLSPWAGQVLYVGVHDQPDGSGHMTHVCISHLQ